MAIAGFTVLILMLSRVNARLPKEKPLRMFILDQNTIIKAYKQLFPGSRLVYSYWFFLIMMSLFLLLLAVSWNI